MPHRRTLATGILPFARSMLATLSPSGLRSPARPAPWHGQPLATRRALSYSSKPDGSGRKKLTARPIRQITVPTIAAAEENLSAADS